MEPSVRVLLGPAVEHALQGSGLLQPLGLAGGPSPHRALTRSLPVRPCTGEAGALRWWPGCVVPAVVTTTAPSDSLSAARHFPCVGYRRACFPGHRPGAEEGLSSSHDILRTVPRPMRRGVRGHPLQVLRCRPWPSPTLHRLGSPLAPLARGF